MQANQQVTFLTDGADDVRDLTMLINENAEHILDWFHVTMRLTVIRQLTKGLDNPARDSALELLQRVKRFLWHGNLYRARQLLAWLHVDLAAGGTARHARLVQLVDDFDGYLDANAASIPNYGERYRAGEAISSAPAESIVNTLIARRMVKRQQMRWTPHGAHRVLQIRARVLDNALGDDFKRWYPNLALHDRPAA